MNTAVLIGASAAVLGSILVAPPLDELSAAVALPPFVADVPRRALTVMLIQGHGPGARDKPAPSACVGSGRAVAVNARSRVPAAASTSAAVPPMPREAPVTRAVLLASLDTMAVSF